jgi:hypothetical protein
MFAILFALYLVLGVIAATIGSDRLTTRHGWRAHGPLAARLRRPGFWDESCRAPIVG